MKKYGILYALICLLPITGSADISSSPKRSPEPTIRTQTARKQYTFENKEYFKEKELSGDVFGLHVFADGDGRLSDDFGGGIGANYFITRHFGLGVDGYWWDGDQVSNEWVSSFSGSAILRMPIDRLHLAPYVMGGVGGHFSGVEQLSFHGGGGLEYRFSPRMGTFVDGRYVFTEDTNDFGMVRFGARFIF